MAKHWWDQLGDWLGHQQGYKQLNQGLNALGPGDWLGHQQGYKQLNQGLNDALGFLGDWLGHQQGYKQLNQGLNNDVFGSGDPGGNQLWHALFGGGGDKPKSKPDSQVGGFAEAQNLIKGLTAGQEFHPDNALIWKLGDLLSKMSPTQEQNLMKQLPPGSQLAEGLNLALTGGAPSQSTQPNPLVQALSQIYTTSIFPALKSLQSDTSAAVGADIGDLQTALKGASPQLQAAMGSIPQQLKASENVLSQASINEAANAPMIQALLQAMTGQSQGYKQASQALGAVPYYQQALQGITPTIPGALGPAGVVAPGSNPLPGIPTH